MSKEKSLGESLFAVTADSGAAVDPTSKDRRGGGSGRCGNCGQGSGSSTSRGGGWGGWLH
jgi:hypothetical protein